MKITLYVINWNDSFYIPFLAKHYSQFCQRMVMYDQHSTDGSQDIANKLGFEIREFGSRSQLNDQWYLDVKNNCWKEERDNGQGADYVIVCDADEFITPDILKGTAPKVRGFNMISDVLPDKDIFEIKTGDYSENYSKQAIFSPKHIEEINFVHGCHRNNMKGQIINDGFCRLFHFRQIGGVDRMIQRHAEYRARMSKFNLQHGMGVHYLHTDEQKKIEWEHLQSKAHELW